MQHMNIVLREDGAGAQKERQPSKSIPVDQWEKLHDVFSWLNWSPPKASPCHETLRKHFPGALPDRAVTDRLCAMLAEYGFDPESTLLGTSICPDEINNEVGDISDMLRSRFAGCFPLGGIGGAPFVGKTGFGAFSSHVPTDGNIFMFFGPHVAVSDTGEVGQYLRVGQAEHSSACGACIGAYKACCKLGGGQTFSGTKLDEDDLQMDWIKKALEPHTEWIQKQTNPMAALAFKSYEAVEGLMLKIVHTNFGTGKLALLGGVQINMPDPYQDHFVPQFFQIYQQGQPAIDLIQEWKRQVPFDPARLLDADQRLLQSWLYSWLAWSPPLDSPVWSIIDSQFAGAVPGQVLHARMLAALEAGPFRFTRDNTLVGTSVCPDEINNEPGDLTDLLQKH